MLPKLIDTPIYFLNLPISKKEIKYRPFLVKEQKILMMALEESDPESIEKVIKQILQNCLISDIDIETLPTVEVEYLYIQLVARSIKEVNENRYRCENVLQDDNVCGHIIKVNVNLLDIEIENYSQQEVIQLTNKVGVKMKFPTLKILKQIKDTDNQVATLFKLIAGCVDYIYDENVVYHASELSTDEIIEFLEELQTEQFSKIEDFFNNIPRLSRQLEFKCDKCGFNHVVMLEGLENFFN